MILFLWIEFLGYVGEKILFFILSYIKHPHKAIKKKKFREWKIKEEERVKRLSAKFLKFVDVFLFIPKKMYIDMCV